MKLLLYWNDFHFTLRTQICLIGVKNGAMCSRTNNLTPNQSSLLLSR